MLPVCWKSDSEVLPYIVNHVTATQQNILLLKTKQTNKCVHKCVYLTLVSNWSYETERATKYVETVEFLKMHWNN